MSGLTGSLATFLNQVPGGLIGAMTGFDVSVILRGGHPPKGNPSGLNVNITSSTAGAVPKPAAWAMMIIGFFGLGTAVRRTKANGALVAGV